MKKKEMVTAANEGQRELAVAFTLLFNDFGLKFGELEIKARRNTAIKHMRQASEWLDMITKP